MTEKTEYQKKLEALVKTNDGSGRDAGAAMSKIGWELTKLTFLICFLAFIGLLLHSVW